MRECNKSLGRSLHGPGHQGIQPMRYKSIVKQASLVALLVELHVYNLGGNGLKLKHHSKKKVLYNGFIKKKYSSLKVLATITAIMPSVQQVFTDQDAQSNHTEECFGLN